MAPAASSGPRRFFVAPATFFAVPGLDDARAPLPWDLVVARELEVAGSHGMAAADYPPMLAMVADGRLRPDLLVGDVIPLERAGAALMAMDDPVARTAGITVATR